MRKDRVTRRGFLKKTGMLASGTVAFPYIIPSSALGADGHVAPSNRITIGSIGVGGQGSGNMGAFLQNPGAQVVAVCDVDRNHREQARNAAGLPPESAYNDFRDVIGRDDIDAVCVSTPDHWHAVIVIAAAQAGKDIFCEKPLSLTLAEGRAIVNAVKANGRILQTGTWRRSRIPCRIACELVRNGRIGNLKTMRCYVPQGYAIRNGDFAGVQPPQAVPEGFDYDMWLGPAPYVAYTPGRCHFNFRWLMDYGEGYISDWGAHFYDVAQWGNNSDDTGPVEIEGNAMFPSDGLYDAPTDHHIEFRYANGVTLIAETSKGEPGKMFGTYFDGDEGMVFVESGAVISEPASIAESPIAAHEIHLYESRDHHDNFLSCIRERRETAAPAETGHRAASICHLGTIACLVGRKLKWDPAKEEFEGDDEANRLRSRPMRAPWHV